MDGGRKVPRPHTDRSGSEWGKAAAAAAIMLVVSILVFVVVPNQLLTYLSLHVAPKQRDLLVATWWVVAFLGACWLFVRLQGKQS
jgi:hypothetical protein